MSSGFIDKDKAQIFFSHIIRAYPKIEKREEKFEKALSKIESIHAKEIEEELDKLEAEIDQTERKEGELVKGIEKEEKILHNIQGRISKLERYLGSAQERRKEELLILKQRLSHVEEGLSKVSDPLQEARIRSLQEKIEKIKKTLI